MRAAPGYLPVRFDITNLGEARVIEIVGRGMRFFRGLREPALTEDWKYGRRFAWRAVIACGSRFPCRSSGDHENLGFEIQEDGRTIDRLQHGVSERSPAADASALIVADPSSRVRNSGAAGVRT